MKVNINGKIVDGHPVSFVPFSEPWAEYHLEDGKILRFKVVITRVFRTDEKADDGQNIYSVQAQNVMVVEGKD